MQAKENLSKEGKKGKSGVAGISYQDNPFVRIKEATTGITLVALVVTVIILLILAGVTITYVLGDRGIIQITKDARSQTDQAVENEQKDIGDLADWLKEEQEELKPLKVADNLGKVISETQNKVLEDDYGNKIKIPAGFKIVTPEQDSTVDYSYSGDGKPNVQDGIVVENVADGNQFVWVPVGTIKNKPGDTEHGETTTIKLGRYSNYTVTDGVLPTPDQEATETSYNTPVAIKINELGSSSNYFEVSSSFEGATVDGKTYNKAKDYGNTKAVNLQEWIRTTLVNKGYYIARYEASQDEKDETKAASKAGKDVWNEITQPNAAIASRATYSSENGSNKEKYYSDLINSYSWDTAIVFIEAYEDSSYASKNLSTGRKKTGENKDQVCNINDMSGNAIEWETETSTGNNGYHDAPCTERGGYYEIGYGTADLCTSYRGNAVVGNSAASRTYRLVLCVK